MKNGIQIGGIDGKNGKAVITALRVALQEALRRGQNDVAKSIASDLARLGHTENVMVSNNVVHGGKSR